jgi:hypothetical protein
MAKMMKQLFIIMIPLLVLNGCAQFPVTVDKDPFKGVTQVTADMWHTVIDSDIDNRRVLYNKEIVNGVVSDPVVSFVFVAEIDPYYHTYNGEGLKPEAYILADDKSYKVNLFERKNRKGKTTSIMYGYGYYWYMPYYGRVIVNSSVRRRILAAKAHLNTEIQSAIFGSHKYMIRFYVGDSALTLEATSKQHESVKKFLSVGRQ